MLLLPEVGLRAESQDRDEDKVQVPGVDVHGPVKEVTEKLNAAGKLPPGGGPPGAVSVQHAESGQELNLAGQLGQGVREIQQAPVLGDVEYGGAVALERTNKRRN